MLPRVYFQVPVHFHFQSPTIIFPSTTSHAAACTRARSDLLAMAVLPGVSHVSVNVSVAGEIATEYEVPSDQTPIFGTGPELPGPVSHCYIEAKTGAEFRIELTVDSAFHFPRFNNSVSLFVYIDGIYLSGIVVQDDTLLGQSSRTAVVADAYCRPEEEGGQPCFKKFVFSSITTSMMPPISRRGNNP